MNKRVNMLGRELTEKKQSLLNRINKKIVYIVSTSRKERIYLSDKNNIEIQTFHYLQNR